ncbi:MAG TPA: DUF2332 domain-containing protein [Candidatus Limnocylindria bacterium]
MSARDPAPGEAQRLAQQYRTYGRFEMRQHGSPIYAALCEGLAGDPGIGRLALEAREGFRTPLILLAAVHYLLLAGLDHPLARYYPSLAGDEARPIDAGLYPAFRDLVAEHREAVRVLVSTRTTQTNEARRTVITLPALGLAAAEAGLPLALLEIGASAGLNLLPDRYGFQLGDSRVGDASSAVQIDCAVEGELRPPVPAVVPTVAWRAGIDLNPLDVRDPDTLAWLRALVWPEHRDRLAILDGAAAIARRDPPRLVRGDLVDGLPALAGDAPRDAGLVVLGTWVLSYLPVPRRLMLIETLRRLARDERRTVWFASVESERVLPSLGVGIGSAPADGSEGWSVLSLHRFEAAGPSVHQLLATCHAHGRWMRWMDAATAGQA